MDYPKKTIFILCIVGTIQLIGCQPKNEKGFLELQSIWYQEAQPELSHGSPSIVFVFHSAPNLTASSLCTPDTTEAPYYLTLRNGQSFSLQLMHPFQSHSQLCINPDTRYRLATIGHELETHFGRLPTINDLANLVDSVTLLTIEGIASIPVSENKDNIKTVKKYVNSENDIP